MSERHHWDVAKRCFARTPVAAPRPTIPPVGTFTPAGVVIGEIVRGSVLVHFRAPAKPRDAAVHRAIAAMKRTDATR